MRVQSPSAVKSTATVTARADGIVTPDALHHRPNVSLLRSSYNKKEASRPSSPSGPPPPLPTPYNAADVTVTHLSSEPLSQDKKDRPSSVRLPRSFQSVLKDSGLNIDSDTLELPLWESEATHQQPARLAEWASVEARLFAVKQPPAVVTEPPSPPKRPPTPTSPAQGLSSPLSSAITLQSGLAAVPKSAPRRRAPGRPGSAASSVATVGTGSVAFTPATPPATPPTDNRSLLPNLPAVVVRPLVQDPSVFPASIIPPRPSGYNSGSRSPAESTVILHGAGVDGSLAEPLEAVEDGIDRLSVPPPPGTVVISSVPLPSAANVVNLISAAVRDEEEGRRLRERAHTEELEEKGEGTSSGVEAPTIAGLLGRKHQVPQSASRSRRSSGVSARVGAGVEEPAVPITSSRLPLLHWPPPHEFSARRCALCVCKRVLV